MEARLVDLLTSKVSTLARRRDVNLAKHLANDHLNVLVVDFHALQTVNVLDLAHEIIGEILDALQTQDVMWIRLAVGDNLTPDDLLAFEDVQVAPLRDQLLVTLTGVVRDDETALALGFLAEADRTGVFSHDCRVLRLAGLEQVGNTWQTTRDVTRFRRFLWNARDDVTHSHLGAVRHADDCADR